MSWQKLLHGLTVRKNSGSNIGLRPRLNFIEGNNIVLSVVDDAVDNEIDITVAASGSSGNLFAATYIMYKSGSTYYAKTNTSTGLSDYSNATFHTLLATVLSAIPAQGGKIYFMPGVYSVTGTITGRSNVIFEGNGNHFGQGGTFFSLDANVDMFIFNAVSSEFEFSHINFDGNDRNYRIFNFNGTSDVAPIQDFAFTKCNFYHCRRAIYGLYAYDVHFTDVGFEQCGYLNTYAAATAHTGCNFWHFKSCRWEALKGRGFYASGTGSGYTINHSFSFMDCKFHGLGADRYTCIYGHLFYSRIVGCLFFNIASANRAIYNQDKGLVINGNTFCCINGYAIELPTGADGCTITGNSFGGAFGDTTGGNPSWILNNAADTALIGNSLFNHTHPLYSGSGTVVMDDYWGAGGGGSSLWTDRGTYIDSNNAVGKFKFYDDGHLTIANHTQFDGATNLSRNLIGQGLATNVSHYFDSTCGSGRHYTHAVELIDNGSGGNKLASYMAIRGTAGTSSLWALNPLLEVSGSWSGVGSCVEIDVNYNSSAAGSVNGMAVTGISTYNPGAAIVMSMGGAGNWSNAIHASDFDSGIYLNQASSKTGHLLNLQHNGAHRFTVDHAGNLSLENSAGVWFQDSAAHIRCDSANLTFSDSITGSKTLAQLAAGGGGLWTDYSASNYIKPDNQPNLRIGDSNTKEWDLLIDKTTISGSPFINKAAQFSLKNAQTSKLGWTIYTEIDSSSTHSDGSVAIYAKAITRGGAYWTAAVHGEVHDRMSSGTAIAGNFEMWNQESHTSAVFGLCSLIRGTYGGQAGLRITRNDSQNWKYGIEFTNGSCGTAHIHSTGEDLYLSANGGSSYIFAKACAIKMQGIAPGFWLDETGSGKKGAFFVLDDLDFQVQRRAQGFGGFEAIPFKVNLTTGNGTFLGTVTASCGVLTCDYVFEDNYGLLSLNCLQKYIKRKKELPNFTLNKGGSYSTENLREELVIKIEEQTLYILQLHERIKKLEN